MPILGAAGAVYFPRPSLSPRSAARRVRVCKCPLDVDARASRSLGDGLLLRLRRTPRRPADTLEAVKVLPVYAPDRADLDTEELLSHQQAPYVGVRCTQYRCRFGNRQWP